jgi:CBS domain-containing protein
LAVHPSKITRRFRKVALNSTRHPVSIRTSFFCFFNIALKGDVMPNRPIREVIGNRPFPTVLPTNTIRECAFIMKEWHSSAVLVAEGGKLLGIFTERDIVFRCVALGCPLDDISVAKVMTANVQTIHVDKPFGHALHLMYEGGFRHMPVVDDDGDAVGLVSAQDALALDGFQLEQELVRREEITVLL